MSRYFIEIEDWPENYQVVVGWDPGLTTYFAQVDDTTLDDYDARSVVWIGTVDIIHTANDLELMLNGNMPRGMPYGKIPENIKEQLKLDKLKE